MAMCGGHKHVISPRQVANWVGPWCHDWFPQCARRLKLVSEEHMPETAIEEARTLHTGWSDEQLMRFVPGCAHESRYVFEVVSNE
jgi:hypothetical protein